MALKGRLGWLLLLVVLLLWPSSSRVNMSLEDQLRLMADGSTLSLANSEARAILAELREDISDLFTARRSRSEVELVREYFSVAREIATMEAHLRRLRSSDSPQEVLSLERQLTEMKERRASWRGQVQGIIAHQVAAVLLQEDIRNPWDLNLGPRFLFPPVRFHFEEPPKLLVVSPRERIELAATLLLRPETSLREAEAIEGRVEKGLAISALVESLGGFGATYPSTIPESPDLEARLNAVAHEWFHHYFFFSPLGFNYLRSNNMRTINETAADIAGREVASLVYRAYYAGVENPSPRRAPGSQEASFDFNSAMRETRLQVERYLAAGQVTEAETYMEEKRRFLASQGYYLRKLNQAYFAYHGSYADSPSSISPIGEEMRQLRAKSASLRDFVATLRGISSYVDLKRVLDSVPGVATGDG